MRYLSKKTAILMAVCPMMANAVGLGEIKVHSALNEALSADVPVIDVGALPVTDIQAKLASPEEFERVGLERSAYAHLLEFNVWRKKHATYVHISSQSPINEPIVTILLSLNAPGGQLLREYTVFLDPPDYRQPSKVVPLSEPEMAPHMMKPSKPFTGERVASSETVSVVSQDQPKPKTKQAVSDHPATYVVQNNDALWKVAGRFASNNTSRYQVMLAIFEKNPKAFRQHNANGLKKNAVLTIPSQQEIQAVSRAQAIQLFAEHEKAWNNRTRHATPDTMPAHVHAKSQLKSAVSDAPMAVPMSANNMLPELNEPPKQPSEPVSSPTAKAGSDTATKKDEAVELPTLQEKPALSMQMIEQEVEGSAINDAPEGYDVAAEIKQLRAELALAMEALNETQQANNQLRQELQAMQQQQNMPKAKQIVTQAAQPSVMSSAVVKTMKKADDTSHEKLHAERTKVLEDLQKQQMGLVADGAVDDLSLEQKKVLMTDAKDTASWMSRIVGLILLMVAGGVSFGIYRSYKNKRQAWQEEELNEMPIDEVLDDAEIEDDELPDMVLSGEEAWSEEKTADDIDILEEIDVYVAYGRYEQALETLQKSIQNAPNRAELRVKLLEVRVAMNDKEKFHQALAQLPEDFAEKNPELWDKVEELKKKITERPNVASQAQETKTPTFDKQIDYEPVDLEKQASEETTPPTAKKPAYDPTKVVDFEPVTPTESDEASLQEETPVEAEAKSTQQSKEDVVATKFDLAQVYIDMADYDEAKALLEEIVKIGSLDHKERAEAMLKSIE